MHKRFGRNARLAEKRSLGDGTRFASLLVAVQAIERLAAGLPEGIRSFVITLKGLKQNKGAVH